MRPHPYSEATMAEGCRTMRGSRKEVRKRRLPALFAPLSRRTAAVSPSATEADQPGANLAPRGRPFGSGARRRGDTSLSLTSSSSVLPIDWGRRWNGHFCDALRSARLFGLLRLPFPSISSLPPLLPYWHNAGALCFSKTVQRWQMWSCDCPSIDEGSAGVGRLFSPVSVLFALILVLFALIRSFLIPRSVHIRCRR